MGDERQESTLDTAERVLARSMPLVNMMYTASTPEGRQRIIDGAAVAVASLGRAGVIISESTCHQVANIPVLGDLSAPVCRGRAEGTAAAPRGRQD